MKLNIQPTYEQMQNVITELMRTNNELHQELSLTQANCKLLQLNNKELSLKVKKSQLNTTISNASVSNNVNVIYKPPPITIKGVKHFDKLKKILTHKKPVGQGQKLKIVSNNETKILTTNESQFRSIYHDSDLGLIKIELYDQGHEVINLTNIVVKKKIDIKNKNSEWTHINLPLFFIDLQSAVCVKCSKSHKTTDCPKSKKIKVKCANCSENHTVNWKGCSAYKKAIERAHPKQVTAVHRIKQKPAQPHYEHEKYSENHIQVTSVVVNDGINNLIVTAIYCPPQGGVDEIRFTTFFHTLGARFIAVGNYNSKHTHWGSRLITPKRRALLKAASNTNAEIISTRKATYWPSDLNKIPDLLDFFVLSLTNKKTNWDLFRSNLDEMVILSVRLRTPIEIDSAIEQLTNNVIKAAKLVTPEIKARNYREITYPMEIRELVKKKRKARKNGTVRKIHWIKLSGTALATKQIKNPRAYVSSIRKEDGSWARCDQDKAETYARNLERAFQPKNIASEIDIEQFLPLNEIKLSKKAIINLIHIYNVILRTENVLKQGKRAEVIMLLKPGKPPEQRLKLIIEARQLIPEHRFGFRNKHSTIEQVHRVTNVIKNALEEKNIACALIESYPTERQFRVIHDEAITDWKNISAGVIQGSVLGPLLYLLYTADIPVTNY
ncbi:hypothetical protein QTP88_006713 [Uroleucon formosanum]